MCWSVFKGRIACFGSGDLRESARRMGWSIVLFLAYEFGVAACTFICLDFWRSVVGFPFMSNLIASLFYSPVADVIAWLAPTSDLYRLPIAFSVVLNLST